MGTPLVAVKHLELLLQSQYNVISVFTQPPRKKNRGMKIEQSPIQQLASKYEIKVHTPSKLDKEYYGIIKSYKPDLIIVMAYGLLIPKKFLNIPIHGFINIHLSLLPKWRGASPIENTLLNGDNLSGVTIIKLIDKLDAGPIITQKEYLIKKNENKDELLKKLNDLGCELLLNILPKLFLGKIYLQDQNEQNVTYARKIKTKDRKIDFNNKASEIINKIRAYSIKPGAWFTYKNERIKIISASEKKSSGKPGTIINENFELACLGGSILPINLQREGKNIVHIDDFLRGFKFSLGDSVNE